MQHTQNAPATEPRIEIGKKIINTIIIKEADTRQQTAVIRQKVARIGMHAFYTQQTLAHTPVNIYKLMHAHRLPKDEKF